MITEGEKLRIAERNKKARAYLKSQKIKTKAEYIEECIFFSLAGLGLVMFGFNICLWFLGVCK